MIDFNQAISLIRNNGGFKHNMHDTSYYRTFTMQGSKPVQVRISNHGTHLWTWYDKNYDPSYAINISIVFSEDGITKSNCMVDTKIKNEIGNEIGKRKPFSIIQYVYNCSELEKEDMALINQNIQRIWNIKGFQDPLAKDNNKHAKVYKLVANQEPIIMRENKQKIIRIKRSELRKLISETVQRTLDERKRQQARRIIAERKIRRIIRESIQEVLLTEGAETRNMKAAKHYLYDKMGYDEQQAMKVIGSIKTDIPNSRLAKCKFMLAMVRMFCERQLADQQTIQGVNTSLKYATSEVYVTEYDQDLNGLTAGQFIQRFAPMAQQDLQADKEAMGKEQYGGNSQYKIVMIDTFEKAEQYGQYTDWCITRNREMYNNYKYFGLGVFYFCLRNGFENEPREKGANCPLDSYGLSMIAVSINEDGSCNTITCRWNHANGGNDSVMTPKQLSQIIGRNFYDVFKPLPQETSQQRWNLALKREINIAMNNPNNFNSGYARIRVNDKCNFIDRNGHLLSPNQWFDKASFFDDGYADVKLNGEHYLIDTKGKLTPN